MGLQGLAGGLGNVAEHPKAHAVLRCSYFSQISDWNRSEGTLMTRTRAILVLEDNEERITGFQTVVAKLG